MCKFEDLKMRRNGVMSIRDWIIGSSHDWIIVSLDHRIIAPMQLNSEYWNERWLNKETGWDMGHPSPAITEFIDTLTDKEKRILIPGCGNAYEAEYLHQKGFKNVVVIDFAPHALKSFSERVPEFPTENLVCVNFFEFKAPPFELIIEQTFFCAIDPAMRPKYVEKMGELLIDGGILTGLLFTEVPNENGPPFGGSEEEYKKLFRDNFSIYKMEPCKNSIEPRRGREVWFELVKRNQ